MVSKIVKTINMINQKTGQVVSYSIIPLTIICLLEVFMRYVLNSPTIWAWDLDKQILSFMTIMGAGYTLLYKGHIRVDILLNMFSPKSRLIVELATYSLFLFAVLILIQQTCIMAINSLKMLETTSSYWAPPVYPIKILIVVGVVLLFLQVIGQILSILDDYFREHSSRQIEPSQESQGE